MARAFNMREGIDNNQDTLPGRLFMPLENGPFQGVAIPKEEFQRAVQLYYQMRGWNEQGKPLPAKLFMLDLEWLIPLL